MNTLLVTRLWMGGVMAIMGGFGIAALIGLARRRDKPEPKTAV